VKYGAKYASLKTDDPYEITPERALEVIREKEIADANRLILDFPDAGIQVLNGRYGPYITDKARNAKIPKDRDPKTLTLEECQSLLAAAPVRTFGKWGKKNGASKGLAAPKGQAGNGKAAKARAPAATADSTAARPRAKVAPIGLAAKASKTAASKKAPTKAPADASAKAVGASAAKHKAPLKSKKSSAKKKP
jgi:DNA topoisomerase-1